MRAVAELPTPLRRGGCSGRRRCHRALQSWQQTEHEHGFDVGFPYTRREVRNNGSSAAHFLPKAQDPRWVHIRKLGLGTKCSLPWTLLAPAQPAEEWEELDQQALGGEKEPHRMSRVRDLGHLVSFAV